MSFDVTQLSFDDSWRRPWGPPSEPLRARAKPLMPPKIIAKERVAKRKESGNEGEMASKEGAEPSAFEAEAGVASLLPPSAPTAPTSYKSRGRPKSPPRRNKLQLRPHSPPRKPTPTMKARAKLTWGSCVKTWTSRKTRFVKCKCSSKRTKRQGKPRPIPNSFRQYTLSPKLFHLMLHKSYKLRCTSPSLLRPQPCAKTLMYLRRQFSRSWLKCSTRSPPTRHKQ
jgi:hypothetical protein